MLREAGEAAAQRTPAGAARWFAAALRLLPASAPPEQRIELLSARAGALAATGEFDDAHAALLEALRIAPREPVARRIELTGTCAGLERVLGRHDDARARLLAALDDLPDPGSEAAAALMIDLGTGAFYRMEYEEARAWADRAHAVARELGAVPLEAAAGALGALALSITGSGMEAHSYRAGAAALVDAMDDDELAVRLDAVAHLAVAESYLDHYAESLAHAERGIAIARATGQGELFPVLIPAINGALFALGRLGESVEMLDGAIEGARLMGNAQPLAWSLLSSAAARMMCGDLDAALAAATESVELGRELGVSLVSSYATAILGLVLIERGDPERGAELLVSTVGGASLPDSPGNWRAWDLERLTQAWLALGRQEAAERAAADAEAFAAATGLRFASALAGRARARVALAAGDAPSAAELALASVTAAEEIGAVAEAALSRTVAGRALAAAGEPGPAAEQLQRAAAALEACGAMRYRDEAELELGKLGRRRHRRTRPGRSDGTGVATLTARELRWRD